LTFFLAALKERGAAGLLHHLSLRLGEGSEWGMGMRLFRFGLKNVIFLV
jgi:hypothetical protein